MRLLVTGGCGFIGSHVVRSFVARPEIERIVNLDCLTYAGHSENIEDVARNSKYVFEQVDLRDKAEVVRVVHEHVVTHVLHLAAESHVDRSITGPDDFIHTNIVGTFHLLEACRNAWLDSANSAKNSDTQFRFHHVSSDEVYGSLGPTGCFTEATPYAPNSPYSASKAASDMLVRAYHRTYGLPAVVTHCSNNYGPYQFPEKLIPVVIKSLIARQPIPLYGDGMQMRDWLFVQDHVEALGQVLTRGRIGETYNIGGNNEWPNLPTVEFVCDTFDELAPEFGLGSRKLITFVADRPGHDRRYAMDTGKIRNELGWTPAYTFERGIRETIQWYLKNQDWMNRVVKNLATRSWRLEM